MTFTAADIAAYHQGRLSAKEMHALERAALEDPFLADALEGYQPSNVTVQTDLSELTTRLNTRIHEEDHRAVSPGFSIPWLKVAAMIVVIAGAALMIYYFGQNSKNEQSLAKVDKNENKTVATGSGSTIVDSAINTPVADSISSTNSNLLGTSSNQIALTDTLVTNKWSGITSTETEKDRADSLTVVPVQIQTNVYAISEAKKKEEALDREIAEQRSKELLAASKARKQSEEPAKKVYDSEQYKAAPTASNNGLLNNKNNNDSFKNDNRSNYSYNVFRGRITDNANNPLPFVNITNPLDNVGTYSDAKGYFSMTYPDTLLNVNVRSLGFANKNISLSNRLTDNQIVLQEDRSNLNEVVISSQKIKSRYRENNLVLEETEPADGWSNYDTYLANNLKVPETYLTKSNSSGEVVLSFEVNKQGQPVDIKVEKSLCETCDKEAIRALKEGPKWKKKAKKGRTSVSISF